MIDLRLRSVIPDSELKAKEGKILTDDDYNVLVTRDAMIRKPDGSPLAIYRRGILSADLVEEAYPTLHGLRTQTTSNRGDASGTERVMGGSGKRSYSRDVPSAIVGAFDPSGSQTWCRLTSFTATEAMQFAGLFPLLRAISDQMYFEVRDRWGAQMEYVKKTDPAWVIPGTPFTTVTVNNTWPTAVHTDKGDLEEGFSNLAVIRRGDYRGGIFVFPRYRVAFDMHDRDLLLMDAHEHHGNTAIVCSTCRQALNGYHECNTIGPGYEPAAPDSPLANYVERISIVAYYRTNMVKCGSPADEAEKQRVATEQRAAARIGQ